MTIGVDFVQTFKQKSPLMKKIILFTLTVLFFASCDKDPDMPGDTPKNPTTPDVIPNAVTDFDGNVYDAVGTCLELSHCRSLQLHGGQELVMPSAACGTNAISLPFTLILFLTN